MKKRLTLDEHNELGRRLFRVVKELMDIKQTILIRYAHKNEMCREADKACTIVGSLRSLLDDEWSEVAPRELTSPYYAQHPLASPEAST